MKQKLIALLLAATVCLMQGVTVFAQAPDAGYYNQTVSVKGDAGKYNANENITLLMLSNTAAAESYTDDDIKYIKQGKVDAEGEYDFNFKVQGDISQYKLLMNLAGENVNDTVTQATAKKDMFDVTLSVDKTATETEIEAQALATIENRYNVSSQNCKLFLVFYDGDGKMTGIISSDPTAIKENESTEVPVSRTIPDNTAIIKAMLWDNTEDLVPLCDAKVRGKERIVCWGDSLTEGAASGYSLVTGETVTPRRYPIVLAELSGREVINKGIGGQGASQIAVRQGGLKLTTTEEFTIPADNTSQVKVAYDLSVNIPIVDNPYDMNLDCSIDDIEGKLTCIDNEFYFTRTTAGKEYTVPVGTQIASADAYLNEDSIAVIWMGTNGGFVRDGIGSDWLDYKGYIEMCDDMIAELETDEYVIVSLTSGSEEGSTKRGVMDDILKEYYGDRYIELRRLMSSDEGAEKLYEDKGITLTDEDKEKMAEGTLPPQILHDGPHFYAEGYEIAAELIYNHMVEIGLLK